MDKETIDLLLERLDAESLKNPDWNSRALFHLFDSRREQLVGLEADYFHKAFRQTDVLNEKGLDLVAWSLLQDAETFWRVFESIQTNSNPFSLQRLSYEDNQDKIEDNQDKMKDFLIQPRTNNSVSLFVRGVRFLVAQDHNKLLILIPQGFKANLTDTSVQFKPSKKDT